MILSDDDKDLLRAACTDRMVALMKERDNVTQQRGDVSEINRLIERYRAVRTKLE